MADVDSLAFVAAEYRQHRRRLADWLASLTDETLAEAASGVQLDRLAALDPDAYQLASRVRMLARREQKARQDG